MKKELEIFPNIPKVILITILSLLFVIPFYISPREFINFDNFNVKSIILLLGVLLFSSSFLFFGYTILRFNKPLLIIYSDRIIIKHHLKKDKIIYFKSVKKFSIQNTYHRGIKSSTLIYVEMNKVSDNYSKSFLYKVYSYFFSNEILNVEFTIQTNFLKIDSKKLLETLNKKLKIARSNSND